VQRVVVGLCVTISIGVSDWLDGTQHEKMLTDADLDAAKRAGRNRTRSAMDAGALDTQEGHAGYPSP
jgi:PleD family two-component response regulator